ncbi:MAG TPA: DUF805 domain-containing protein [Pseudolabrys sp.]|jgi:uncharacterized membrane protein YhaH (DUF805 family)|nr:DUF805 domain-containing protein [Pseudolabrys sp.]
MDVDFWPLLFSFQGRINRAKYWIATVTYISVTIALVGLGFFFRFDTIFFVVAAIVFVALTVSGIAVGLKRLHDRDMSGWWLLVFYLLPAVLDGFGRAIGVEIVFSLAGSVISIWALVVLGFLRGTSGANQYGPDPLGT